MKDDGDDGDKVSVRFKSKFSGSGASLLLRL